MKIICDKCNKELKELGALAFSPATKKNKTTKYHICKGCWKKFLKWLKAS